MGVGVGIVAPSSPPICVGLPGVRIVPPAPSPPVGVKEFGATPCGFWENCTGAGNGEAAPSPPVDVKEFGATPCRFWENCGARNGEAAPSPLVGVKEFVATPCGFWENCGAGNGESAPSPPVGVKEFGPIPCGFCENCGAGNRGLHWDEYVSENPTLNGGFAGDEWRVCW